MAERDLDPFAHLEGASSYGRPGTAASSSGASSSALSEYSAFDDEDGASTVGDASEYDVQQQQSRIRAANGQQRPIDLDLDLNISNLNQLTLGSQSSATTHSSRGPKHRNPRSNAFDDTREDVIVDLNGDNGALVKADDEDDGDVEGLEEEELPEHACAYCGIHNTSCVVKCLICNKW